MVMDENSNAAPEWVQVGAKVALLTGRGSYDSVSFSTITKITKRDVVLESGTRYSNDSWLSQRGRGTWDTSSTMLPREHEQVQVALAAQRLRNARRNAEQALSDWRRTNDAEHGRKALAILQEAFGS